MFLLAFVIVGFSLFAVAFAQSVPSAVALTFGNIKLAASNPLTMAGLIVTAVADMRSIEPKINGKIMVTAVAIIVGAVIAVFFQLIGWLAVAPFSGWATPWGGITYGAAMGVFARYGFNVIDLLLQRHAAAQVNAQAQSGAGSTSNPPAPTP
jgi:hypothetical protein